MKRTSGGGPWGRNELELIVMQIARQNLPGIFN